MSDQHNVQSNDQSSNTSNPRQGNQMNDSRGRQRSSTDNGESQYSGQSESPNPQQRIVGEYGNKSGVADIISDQWNEIKGQIKQRWGQLTDDDLMQAQGNFEQLVGLIQQRSGQSRETVEHELRHLLDRQSESEGSAAMGGNTPMRNNKDITGSGQTSDANGEDDVNCKPERPAKLVAAN